MKTSLLSAVLGSLVVALASCATTPAAPPSLDEIKSYTQVHGVSPSYQHYKVEVKGNAFFGHDVVVGDTGNSAPARAYFAQSPLDVPHTGDWATWPGTILLGGGTLVTSVFAILVAANIVNPFLAIGAMGGCALPMLCGSLVFSTISEWDMPSAGAAYNDLLRGEMEKVQPAQATGVVTPAETPPAEATPATTTAPATDPAQPETGATDYRPPPSDAPVALPNQ